MKPKVTVALKAGRGQRAGDGTGKQVKVQVTYGDSLKGTTVHPGEYVSASRLLELMKAWDELYGPDGWRRVYQ